MFVESALTLVPAIAVLALAAVAVYIGYAVVTCSVARVQGKECHSC
jgi:hypothetical protein